MAQAVRRPPDEAVHALWQPAFAAELQGGADAQAVRRAVLVPLRQLPKGNAQDAGISRAVALGPGAGAARRRARLSAVGGNRRASRRDARPLPGRRSGIAPGRAGMALLEP